MGSACASSTSPLAASDAAHAEPRQVATPGSPPLEACCQCASRQPPPIVSHAAARRARRGRRRCTCPKPRRLMRSPGAGRAPNGGATSNSHSAGCLRIPPKMVNNRCSMVTESGARSTHRTQRRAYGGDDHTAERHRGRGPQESRLEEPRPDPGQHEQLERHGDDGRDQSRLVLRDQERQGVQDPARERAGAGDGAAPVRTAAPGQLPLSESPSENAMLTPAPIAVATPARKA